MSAIGELRKLLDERGVEHSDHYFSTTWRGRHGTLHLASEMCDNSLLVDTLTPEQAIAATLGDILLDEFVHGMTCKEVCEFVGSIVRCRDCKWMKNDKDLCICQLPDNLGHNAYWFVNENGFCAWGERK